MCTLRLMSVICASRGARFNVCSVLFLLSSLPAMSSEPESASQGGGEPSTQADATNTFSQDDGRDPLSQQPRSSKRSLQYDPFGQDKEKRELRQQYRSLIGSTKG